MGSFRIVQVVQLLSTWSFRSAPLQCWLLIHMHVPCGLTPTFTCKAWRRRKGLHWHVWNASLSGAREKGLKNTAVALVSVTQFVGMSSCSRKVASSIPDQGGHIPRLWVQSLVWARIIPHPGAYRRQPRHASLLCRVSLSPFLSLNAMKKLSLGED